MMPSVANRIPRYRPAEAAMRRARAGVAGPGPGEATDDASAIEREGRQQVDPAEQEVHGPDREGDPPHALDPARR